MTDGLPVVRDPAALRSAVARLRAGGARVALVPTMGALHDGHIVLVRAAQASCGRVVVSLFVNPTQFGPGEDFARYPRDEARDGALLAAAGADLLYAPTAAAMYADGFATTVSVGRLAAGLCGPFRPGHFQGVATVVTKLLVQCAADAAFFGEKDYQQLALIRRLARDLDIPTAIEGVATVRDADGLALSSRNAYLSPEERRVAPVLHRTLAALAEAVAGGADTAPAIAAATDRLAAAGFAPIDYVAVCDAETLEPLARVDRPARVLAAARLGTTRLIDNLACLPRR
ncbi:MAG: pantoate--beta-alanine ligase [Alphaproteobacteria bacterium]|nr:pantoate--beta-alanine ligase [Alphaproteobacteria bacterium]